MPTKDNDNLRQQAKERTGASEEQLRKNELVGKLRGQDIDPTFHTYQFTDPSTGEPVETHQVVHDVAVGVNKDGSLETEKMTDSYAKAEDFRGIDKARESETKAKANEKSEKEQRDQK